MRRTISILLLLVLIFSIAHAQTSSPAASYLNRAMQRYAQGDLDGAVNDFDAAIEYSLRLEPKLKESLTVRIDKVKRKNVR